MRLPRGNGKQPARSRLLAGLVAGTAVLLPSFTAVAQVRTDGPSNAPLVEIGKARTVTHSGRDYWRVPLAANDQLAIVAFTPISADGTACLCAPGVTDEFTYRFFVRVLRGTTTILQAPGVVRSGRAFVLRGRVRSADTGSAVVSRRTGRGWKAIGTAYLDHLGRFTLRTRVVERELVQFRARYSGDEFHRESSSGVVSVRVR